MAFGAAVAPILLLFVNTDTVAAADQIGFFAAVMRLYDRVAQPTSTDWWRSTFDVVDVQSVWLQAFWLSMGLAARFLPTPTKAAYWPRLLTSAIEMCKVNAAAKLSSRSTIAFMAVREPLTIIEATAKDEGQHQILLVAGVLPGLEFGIVHDYVLNGSSTASYVAGAALAMVGRNEGGRTLGKSAVFAVLDRAFVAFVPGTTYSHQSTAEHVLLHFGRVSTMAVSDANKTLMLQHDRLVQLLVSALLLDVSDPRHGQTGADALQEASAAVLLQLALFEPAAAQLRSDTKALDALSHLLNSGTPNAKESAEAALFQLQGCAHHRRTAQSDERRRGALRHRLGAKRADGQRLRQSSC